MDDRCGNEPDALDLVLAASSPENLRTYLALLDEELAHPDETQARTAAVIAFHADNPTVRSAPPEHRAATFDAELRHSLQVDAQLEQAIRLRMQRETLRRRMRAHLDQIEAPPDRFEA